MKKKISFMLVLAMCFSLISMSAFATEATIGDKTFTIREDFNDSEIPEGYNEATISFEGIQTRGIANNADTEYQFYLTSNEDESLNGWYVYLGEGKFQTEEKKGITIVGGSLTIETPGSDVAIPEGITQTTVDIAGKTYDAYVPSDEIEDGLNNYIVYGTMDGVEHAWYMLDVDSKMAVKTSIDTYGKMSLLSTSNSDLTEKLEKLNSKYNKTVTKSRYLFIVMSVLSMLFLFLMINAMIKRRHERIDMEDRILDLRINHGRDTMKIGNKDLKKRNKRDLKAMDRNDIDPTQITEEEEAPRKRRKRSVAQDNDPDFTSNPLVAKEPAKPKKPSKREMKLDDIESAMSSVAGDDEDDDIEFVSLDL